jgi:hypothetical protein
VAIFAAGASDFGLGSAGLAGAASGCLAAVSADAGVGHFLQQIVLFALTALRLNSCRRRPLFFTFSRSLPFRAPRSSVHVAVIEQPQQLNKRRRFPIERWYIVHDSILAINERVLVTCRPRGEVVKNNVPVRSNRVCRVETILAEPYKTS